jgi:hypothetical protein
VQSGSEHSGSTRVATTAHPGFIAVFVPAVRTEAEHYNSCRGAVEEQPGKTQAGFRTFMGEVHTGVPSAEPEYTTPTVTALGS